MNAYHRPPLNEAAERAIEEARSRHAMIQALDDERRALCAERTRAVARAAQAGASYREIGNVIGMSAEAVRKSVSGRERPSRG